MPSKDPEKIREKNRRYREKYREVLNEKARQLSKTDEGKAKRREYDARFRESHPDYYREYRDAHSPEGKVRRYPKGPIGGPDDPRHGTTGGYGNHKCRCDPCRLAWNTHMRNYKAKRKAQSEAEKHA